MITNDIRYIGVNDRKIDLFEGQYRVPNGMAYNSYVILDDKIAVMDTVDKNFTQEWLDNLEAALNGRKPDYLIVQHMEPDHSASIGAFTAAYPNATVVANARAFTMMNAFFSDLALDGRKLTVENGGTLSLGKHILTFIFAPMVHWPEVMVTYDSADRVLFSADGFGKFGALDTDGPWEDEARRYYIGIVGKYGAQVQQLLKAAATLDIAMICPLHGPVLKDNLAHYLALYDTWSSYRPEKEGVVIAYTSVYGNTEKAVKALADTLTKKGAPEVKLFDLARCDLSEAVAAAFAYPKLVLATTTYNGDIFPFMRSFIEHLTERFYQNRTVALIENGSWAPLAAKIMRGMLEKSKNITFTAETLTVRSAMKASDFETVESIASELCEGYEAPDPAKRDTSALFKIGYGLYIVTSRDGERDNGLIVNTVTQITNTPNRVAVTVSKANYSHHVIKKTGKMNVNCLTVDTPFSVFERFGFASGRNTDKFAGATPERAENGIAILPEYSNAYLSLTVETYLDADTHGIFICRVDEARVLSDKPTMTYTYYQENVKPKPEVKGKKGYVCDICGYVYEGDPLPADFVCPLCKHGAEDFSPIE